MSQDASPSPAPKATAKGVPNVVVAAVLAIVLAAAAAILIVQFQGGWEQRPVYLPRTESSPMPAGGPATVPDGMAGNASRTPTSAAGTASGGADAGNSE